MCVCVHVYMCVDGAEVDMQELKSHKTEVWLLCIHIYCMMKQVLKKSDLIRWLHQNNIIIIVCTYIIIDTYTCIHKFMNNVRKHTHMWL